MTKNVIVNQYLKALKRGDIIMYPADGTLGLGCDILNKQSVENIYKLKQRDRSKPLTLLVSSIDMLKQYVESIHPRIETLLVYHRRPLTIIYKANEHIPKFLLSDEGAIGIRYIHDPFWQSLINALGRPITSAGANKSGENTPFKIQEVPISIREQVFYEESENVYIKSANQKSIVANYNEEGELLILRD